jgi:hypothetical protein
MFCIVVSIFLLQLMLVCLKLIRSSLEYFISLMTACNKWGFCFTFLLCKAVHINECIKYVSNKYVLLIRERKDLMICIIDTLYVVLLATSFSAVHGRKQVVKYPQFLTNFYGTK